MQQFTRKPVTVYRWDDTGAPQIGVNTAGDFKTVLKACLNTGYGSKTSLGWDIVGEDTNRIAVRSANAASTKSVLRVDDSNGTTALISAYESMSDIDTGTGLFEYYEHTTAKHFHKSAASSGASRQWILIGHDAAFWFVSFTHNNSNSVPFFFGDFPSFKGADQFNCALVTHLGKSVVFDLSNWAIGLSTTIKETWVASASRAYNQTTKANSLVVESARTPGGYPDQICGGWVGSTAYLVEAGSFRGILPGVASTSSIDMSTRNALDFAITMPALADSGDSFIFVKQSDRPAENNHGFVINATAWLSP